MQVQSTISMPPLPAWATRALNARGGSRTRTETLFERATSAVWVTRAQISDNEYGRRDSNPQEPPSEDGVSAICTTPACDAGGGIRTLTGLLLPTALSTPRVCHLRHTSQTFGRLRGKDSNLHDLFQRQASCLWTTPDEEVNPARLERAASGSADLRSDPSELRVQTKSGGGATRTHRGAPEPGGLACRCTAFCAAPPRFGGRCGSRTHRSFRLRQFSGLLGVPVPNLPLMHQEGLEPPCSRRATALQAAAGPIRRLMRVSY